MKQLSKEDVSWFITLSVSSVIEHLNVGEWTQAKLTNGLKERFNKKTFEKTLKQINLRQLH